MRFCQIDGTPLVGDDGDATIVQGAPDDILDVPAASESRVVSEEPLIDIPPAEPEIPRPDFGSSGSTPPPSPFSTPEAESSYSSAKEDEIRSTFGEPTRADWTPPTAPVASWQSQEIGSTTPFSSPPVGVGNKDQTMAIVSLVLGIIGLTACCGVIIPSLAAMITGYMARNKAKNNPNQFGGEGLAMAGLITGIIGVVGGILIWIFYSAMIFASIASGGRGF